METFAQISQTLYNELSGIQSAWQTVEKYKGLWFFPVDNTKAQGDPVILELMATIERVALAEDYIKKLVCLPSSSGHVLVCLSVVSC